MQLKLLRLTPELKERLIYAWIDLEIVDWKIKLKGVEFIIKGKDVIINLPKLYTPEGVRYTPFNFVDRDDYHTFRKALEDVIQKEHPLVKWKMGRYDIELQEIPT